MKNSNEIKCTIWDLDGTIWNGVLLEGDPVRLRPGIKTIIQTLDRRGILQSIASKNDHETAMAKLRRFGLEKYFLYPEINWNTKSSSIARIQANFNITMDSLLFIDDEDFELLEVQSEHPEVMCLKANNTDTLLAHPRLNPRFISKDSGRRRQLYLERIERNLAEEKFVGPRSEFLASLNMQLTISLSTENDLKRAEELCVRTNQLNTTGKTYDYDELKEFIYSKSHKLYICELQDKFGYQGKVGLALIELNGDYHYLRLFIMSCRVMSSGVGTVLLSYVMHQAKAQKKILRADFKHTGRNRPMFITLKMANFKEVSSDFEGEVVLQNDLSLVPPYPPYLKLSIPN